MKECLDYIKSTGEEIKSLNDEIKKLNEENKSLIKRIGELESELAVKEEYINNLGELANRWHREYNTVLKKNSVLEDKYDVVSMGLATVAPHFKEAIDEDLDKGVFMSELIEKLDNIKGW